MTNSYLYHHTPNYPHIVHLSKWGGSKSRQKNFFTLFFIDSNTLTSSGFMVTLYNNVSTFQLKTKYYNYKNLVLSDLQILKKFLILLTDLH